MAPTTSPQNEEMKMTSTGAVKDPETGASAKASDSNPAVEETSAQKAMREAKAKLTGATPKANKPTADNPNPDAIKAPTSDESNSLDSNSETSVQEESEENKPLGAEITDLQGKLVQGDSFTLEFRKAGTLVRIPISMETARDTYTLDNTFKIIREIQATKSKKDLEANFASFLPEGV